MPKFSVSKSVQIDAPIDKVYAIVRDFKQWQPWSPWLIAEPEAKVTYAEDGKSHDWDGQVTGSGGMKIIGEKENSLIDYKLTFLKPWKSLADVKFHFTEKDGKTEATWTMDSSLPFFMFFMKNMMVAFIGMDYQRGLDMLKAYAETGSVPSKLEFPGPKSFPGCEYVGAHRACTMEQMPGGMEEDFSKLKSWLQSSGTEAAGVPFSIYHKWDMVKGLVEYTACIPVASAAADLKDGLRSGSIPACQTYPVKHTGRYSFLGNAWSSGHMHGRSKKFKMNKGIHPFETYENDPDNTDENDLVTVVHFPMK